MGGGEEGFCLVQGSVHGSYGVTIPRLTDDGRLTSAKRTRLAQVGCGVKNQEFVFSAILPVLFLFSHSC